VQPKVLKAKPHEKFCGPKALEKGELWHPNCSKKKGNTPNKVLDHSFKAITSQQKLLLKRNPSPFFLTAAGNRPRKDVTRKEKIEGQGLDKITGTKLKIKKRGDW